MSKVGPTALIRVGQQRRERCHITWSMSRNAAAKRFGVSIRQRRALGGAFQSQGRDLAGSDGEDRPSGHAGRQGVERRGLMIALKRTSARSSDFADQLLSASEQ